MTRQPTTIDIPVNKPPLYSTKKNSSSNPVTNKRLPIAPDSSMDFLSQLNSMAQDVTPGSNSNATAKNDFFNMDKKPKRKPKDFLKSINDIDGKDLASQHTNDRVYRKSDIKKEKGKKPRRSPKKGCALDDFDFESSGRTATSDRSSGRISTKFGQYAESSDDSEVEKKRKRNRKDPDHSEYGKAKKERPKMKLDDLLFEIPTKMSNFSQELPLDVTPVAISSQEALGKDSVKCPVDPLCAKILKKPFSQKLQHLFEEYQRVKDNPRARMTARHRFCDYHNAEEHVIPHGIASGYHLEIEFKKLPERIKQFTERLEGIINGRIRSKFRDAIIETFNSEGAWKAQGTSILNQGNATKFLKIEQAQCGYYGWTGSNYIFKELLRIFKVEKSILTPEKAFPQSVNDFIQLVLVPETALLLIAQDQKLNVEYGEQLKQAERILRESSEFGNTVHGILVKDEDMLE